MKGFKPSKIKIKSEPKSNINKKTMIIAIVAVVLLALIITGVVIVTKLIIHGNQISFIYLAKGPDKISYYQNEAINYDGMIVMAKRYNGETYQIPIEECTITGFNSSEVTEKCTVKVTYNEFSTDFTVIIKESLKPTPIPAKLTIETYPQTEYKLGDQLNTTGGVIVCEYGDGSTQRITMLNRYVSGFDQVNGAGEYTLTVKYKENGVTVYTTYTITVTE